MSNTLLLKCEARYPLQFALLLVVLFLTLTASAYSEGKKIQDIRNESYISEYSLATNDFFQPEVWSVLNADSTAGQLSINI